jgi:spore protease
MGHYSDILLDIVTKYSLECGDFIEGTNYFTYKYKFGASVEKYSIDSDELCRKYVKSKGNYTLFSISDVLLLSSKVKRYYVKVLEGILREYLALDSQDSILIVGLGNENISADSLGSKVVSKCIVSRNMMTGVPMVSAICPGVMGVTGIESADMVYSVVDMVQPTKIIIIDSLCASAVDRLGRSIQVTDTGITPGGGVGNVRKSIATTSKAKVVVVGVPMVVYVETFLNEYVDMDKVESDVKDLFVRENISLDIIQKLSGIVSKHKTIDYACDVVTHKDIEMRVDVISSIISSAINSCIFGVCDIDEM